MPTLVLPPLYNEDTVRLAQAAARAGWDVQRLESWDLLEEKVFPEAVLYGEPGFAEHVAPKTRVRLVQPAADLLARLPQGHVRRSIEPATLGDARRRKGKFWIWPMGKKVFPKKIYIDGGGLPGTRALPDAQPIVFGEVVEWDWEYRFFATGGSFTTFSPFRQRGMMARDGEKWRFDEPRDREAGEFVRELLVSAVRVLPVAFALDVGLRDGKWAVVDVVGAYEAPLLGCSEDKALPVVRKASCV